MRTSRPNAPLRWPVAWIQHNFLENRPLNSVLSGVQGLRYGWALPPIGARNGADQKDSVERISLLSAGPDKIAGTRYERKALDEEFTPRAPLELRGASAARREQAVLGTVAVMALGCSLAPPLLFGLGL